MPKVPYVLFTRDKVNNNSFKFNSEVELVLREAGFPSLRLIDDDYPDRRSFGHAQIDFSKSSVRMRLQSLKQFQKLRGIKYGDRITFFTRHIVDEKELHFKVKRRNERGEWGLVRHIGRRQQEPPQNQPPPPQDPQQDPPAPPQDPLAPPQEPPALLQELSALPRLLKRPRSAKTARAATRSAASTARLPRWQDQPPPPQCAQQDPPAPPQPLALPQEPPFPPQEPPAPPRLLEPSQNLPPQLVSDWEKVIDQAVDEIAGVITEALKEALKGIFRR